jgi:hypothetical protein
MIRITGTAHGGQHTASSFLVRIRNVSYKCCTENQNARFMFNFFSKLVSLWDNVEEYYGAGKVTDYQLHIRTACYIIRIQTNTNNRCKMTNKCVEELVGFILYFTFTPTCFGKWLPSWGGGVVGALEATLVYLCCGRIRITIRPQYRHCLSSFYGTYNSLKMATNCRNMLG